MDRAHRIGQKKVVNVYRIITQGSLESKIMEYLFFSFFIINFVYNGIIINQ